MLNEPSTTDFGALFEPHRRELRAHCYRMLGSLADADDATQDTMLRAFRASGSLESTKAARAWLYQIATNVCLDRLARRPAVLDPGALVDPCPDSIWESTEAGPEARISARESVALAFMVALSELPPLQRAVLLLRDVLGWSASEAASLLDHSEASVNSALQRARERCPAPARARPTSLDPSIESLLGRYVRAWESGDAGALTSLLRDDARLTMPPGPIVTGRDEISAFLAGIYAQVGPMRVLPVPVAGGVGFAAYQRAAGDTRFRPLVLQHVEVGSDGIAALHSYMRPALFPLFGLPDSL